MKILVIEDEKLLAESIRAVLEQKGFEVETGPLEKSLCFAIGCSSLSLSIL